MAEWNVLARSYRKLALGCLRMLVLRSILISYLACDASLAAEILSMCQ